MALTKQQLAEINSLAREAERLNDIKLAMANVVASPSSDDVSTVARALPGVTLTKPQISGIAQQLGVVANSQFNAAIDQITAICYEASEGYNP